MSCFLINFDLQLLIHELEIESILAYCFHSRYMSQTKHKDALDLVYDGATVLLNHGQVNLSHSLK